MYTPYVDEQYYLEVYGGAAFDGLQQALRAASRHIDTLTYNRIVKAGGIDALTEFQQEIVREAVCRQAEFEHANAGIIENILSNYSINGVSMGFNGDGWNVHTEGGVVMKRDTYSFLAQTGLCVRLTGR